jgi:hypothetical protein
MPIATPTTYVTNENCQIVIPTPIIKVNPALKIMPYFTNIKKNN